MKKPTFGSAFAGIGGFEKGLERAGWECRWQIENDKFCNRILEKHWPEVRRYEDIEGIDPKELEAVDLICGGFPCQDLSVAGKRGGLSGERSGLFWELVRLVRGVKPRWLLIENVPGFLSSNEGEDFALALETLAECGYGLAWRVLDSQYFGVPQRRRRIFIVGHLGAMCPPEILFESEGGEGDIAESGKAGEETAYCLSGSPRHRSQEPNVIAYGSKESGIAPTLRSPDPNAPRGPDGKRRDGGPGEKIPIIAGFSAGQSAEAGSIAYEEERSPTLRGEPSGTNQVPSVITALGDPNGGRLRQSEDRGGRQADAGGEPDERQADGIATRDDGEEADPNGVREASGVPRRVDLPVCFESRIRGDDGRGYEREPRIRQDDKAWTVQCADRLNVCTETKEGCAHSCPDSPRYRALGNAVTVQVAEWIGRRILDSFKV